LAFNENTTNHKCESKKIPQVSINGLFDEDVDIWVGTLNDLVIEGGYSYNGVITSLVWSLEGISKS